MYIDMFVSMSMGILDVVVCACLPFARGSTFPFIDLLVYRYSIPRGRIVAQPLFQSGEAKKCLKTLECKLIKWNYTLLCKGEAMRTPPNRIVCHWGDRHRATL